MRTSILLAPLLLALSGCTLTTGAEDTLVLEVAEARVPCMGIAPQECFLVRRGAGEDLQLFYDGIAGFDYEPGYRYRLLVGRRTVANPPADASSYAYRLRSVQAKVRSPRADLLAQTAAAETRWRDARPVSYVMVQERHCFCATAAVGPVRLEVTRAEGTSVSPYERVTAARYVRDGSDVAWDYRRYFLSVQDLFGYIRWAIAEDADRIDVEFDEASGYPRRVSVDREEFLSDDEVEYVVESLVAVTP